MQLSLPLHCVRPIPHNTMFGSPQSMDVSALERRLAEDSQSNVVTPLLVLAEAGSVLTGHCDNVPRLREICDKYNVWLHLRGHSLAALALNNFTKDLVIFVTIVSLFLFYWDSIYLLFQSHFVICYFCSLPRLLTALHCLWEYGWVFPHCRWSYPFIKCKKNSIFIENS